MIGKAEWFERRKYGGWGLHPKTWQGWVYIAVFMLPFIAFQALPWWDVKMRVYVTLGWLALLLLDVVHIMITLKRDELEYKIEAISERNAAWVMVAIITAGVLYQVFQSSMTQSMHVDWFLVAALFGGVIAKSVSNIVLEKRGVK